MSGQTNVMKEEGQAKKKLKLGHNLDAFHLIIIQRCLKCLKPYLQTSLNML